MMARNSTQENIPQMSEGPLFVVGVPRSGTSLLYALLNQHPQIALLYEGDLPALWPLFLTRRSKAQWLKRWDFWNESVKRHQIDADKIPSEVSDIKTATEIAYKQYASQKNASIWGCKTPNQYDNVVRLADLFPNAKFVMIRRDPADVCRSIIRASKENTRFQQKGLTLRVLLGSYQLQIERDRLLQRGAQVHELQYRDLTKTPVEELTKICAFLGIPFHSRMASLENADHSALMEGAHNTMVRGEAIVASRKRSEVLPAELRNKIERYKSFWRQKDKDVDKTTCNSPEENNLTEPSLSERAYDQVLYRLLRRWDSFVVFVYCFAPIKWLAAYRAWKGDPHITRSTSADKGFRASAGSDNQPQATQVNNVA